MADFDGLGVLITGAATGLGAATAIGIARQGGRVIINYRTNRAAADETADACRSAGSDVRVVQGDVADDGDCQRIVEAATDWKRLNALINCAAATKHAPIHRDLEALSAEDFHTVFAVNTIAPFQMVRAARTLLEAGARVAGRASAVVNVSSVGALNGTGSSIAYTVSKAALNCLTLSLARALAPEIRVNALLPGYMDTPWWGKSGPEAAGRLRDMIRGVVPLEAASTPEDIADAVMFLAGPRSRHMTGEIVGADAGLRLIWPLTPRAEPS